jgi:hypothetical protein
MMDAKTEVVFHGFLQLANLEKLALVNAINEYFDSTEREPIRATADERYRQITEKGDVNCPCCGE